MSIDLVNLAAQGRAKSAVQAWEPEEFEAVIALERERHITRQLAADYFRNGIMTLEAYDRAVEEDFQPLSQDEAAKKAEADLKERGAEIAASAEKPKKTVRKAKK